MTAKTKYLICRTNRYWGVYKKDMSCNCQRQDINKNLNSKIWTIQY